MNPNDLFSSYANQVITGNNLLWGTNSFLDDAGLKNTLTINMSETLAIHLISLPELEQKRLSDLEFELWIPAITRIDNVLNGQKRQMREVAEDLFNKCPCLEGDHTHKNNNYNPSYASGANTTTARNPSNAYNDQNQPRFSQKPSANNNRYNCCSLRCPALTGEEREVLARHDGCFKCRLPYMPHITRDCPNDFPSPDNYEVHTDAWCQCRKPKPVASVHAIYDNTRTSDHQP